MGYEYADSYFFQMPTKKEMKKERDRRYRLKKKNDFDYKKRRNEAVKRCVTKKRLLESERDTRMRRKYERERKRNYRSKKGKDSSLDESLNSSVLSRSEAATARERKREKRRFRHMKQNNVALQRKLWKISKAKQRLMKKKQNADFQTRLSPKKMAMETLKSEDDTTKVLIAHYGIMQHFKDSKKDKKVLMRAAKSVITKYRGMKKYFKNCSSLDYRTLRRVRTTNQKKSKNKQVIQNFFCRDDNSRLTSGKKETKTQQKEKRQKRFLNFSIEFLYEKFKSENNEAIGRTTFFTNRPFHVIKPKVNDRDQCLCIQCCNTQVNI